MRNIIVTGGSRGLGPEVSRRLANAGYRAIAMARKTNNDLSASIPELVRNLYKDFGPIYGLVNNATQGFEGTLAVMPNSQIECLVCLHTFPIVLTTYVVYRMMMSDGGGRIVNIASITAFTGHSGLSVYAATKSSIIGCTRSLAREVDTLGINANAIAPGFMDTEMTQSMDEQIRQKIARRSALKRFPALEDVADAVDFLVSDRSNSITGSLLTADAGTTA
jgi:3-oxoacyl-[acyl-carrier protein] reductase